MTLAAAIAASVTSHRNLPDAGARRVPYRFVWQMDAATHMVGGIENFATVVGPETASVLNRTWAEVAAILKLDTDGALARALASHDTWSGVAVSFPVDGSRRARLPSRCPACRCSTATATSPAIAASACAANRSRRHPPLNRKRRSRSIPTPWRRTMCWPSARRPAPEPAPEPGSAPAPALSPGEHSAFEELARELNARLKGAPDKRARPDLTDASDDFGGEAYAPPPPEAPKPARTTNAEAPPDGRPMLDRLPIGILVYRLNNLIYANRAFLDWTGYATLDALAEAGGLDSLFIEQQDSGQGRRQDGAQDTDDRHQSTASRSRSKAACSACRGMARTRWF